MPGLQPGHPVLELMKEVIHSPEGKKAAEDAAAAGKPAMAGVDLLLQEALGPKYRKFDQGPQRAGWEVGQIMRAKGYKPQGTKRCGEGRLCGKAILWVRP